MIVVSVIGIILAFAVLIFAAYKKISMFLAAVLAAAIVALFGGLDGAASLMLTGETAAGRHPLEAMEYLAKTARCALRDLNQGVSLFRPEGAETATKTLKLGDSVQWRT